MYCGTIELLLNQTMPITLKYMREDFISSLFLRCLVKKGEDKIITFMKKHKIAQWIMTILCFFSVFQNLIRRLVHTRDFSRE